MPLTIYSSEGLPKLPLGPQGEKGDQGPKGDTGPTGPGVPTGGTKGQLLTKTGSQDFQTGWETPPPKRWWQLPGDGSGDSQNPNPAAWVSTGSPVFTVPANGWYRIWASFTLQGMSAGMACVGAVLADSTVIRKAQISLGNGEVAPIALHPGAQLTQGQKVTLGHQPATAGKISGLLNSGGFVPMLVIQEVDPPSTP